ncbi:MucBP domain-containing protein [Secundilactobacillus folii]|uniref:Uncharacterized protein n=1 Tax=Secundilactobacillus folii TaxID=2678357 RepID=A0A7X3C3I8_9LACO|nr:MucBP domain-containing protein [Secundilactobacillus folii]MTV82562.1 hypothetical protein [Secundilactobacillus folii]
MVKYQRGAKPVKPSHVLIASALFSSSLLFGSLLVSTKAHAENTNLGTSTNVDMTQDVAGIQTSEKVATAGAGSQNSAATQTNSTEQANVSSSADGSASNKSSISDTALTTVSHSTETNAQQLENDQSTPEQVQTPTPNSNSTQNQTTAQSQKTTQPEDQSGTSPNANEVEANSAPETANKQVNSSTDNQLATESGQPIESQDTAANQSTTSSALDDSTIQNAAQFASDPEQIAAVAAQTLAAVETTAPAPLSENVIQKVTLNVPVPADGTNAIKATNAFNISTSTNFSYVNVHPKMTSVSQGKWQGYDYAAAIPDDAIGTDPTTKAAYIDEWMPDTALQYLLYTTDYATQYSSFATFRSNFSKSSLSTLTDFTTLKNLQETDPVSHNATTYWAQLMLYLQTLEGLQYATNLQTINLSDDSDVTQKVYQGATHHGYLWDITALANLHNLTSVQIVDQMVQDASPLKSMSLNNFNLSFNAISDGTGVQVASPSSPMGGLRYQYIPVTPLVLPTGTTSVQIDYNVFGANGQPRVTKPYNGTAYPGDNGYAVIASTADGANVGVNSVVFSNLLKPPAGKMGVLTVYAPFFGYDSDAPNATPDSFEAYVLIPYYFADGYGNVNVNYQFLQADGLQKVIGPTETLANPVGTTYDLNNNTYTNYPMSYLTDRLNGRYIVLDGTGKYSDYVAQNGLANLVPSTGITAAGETNLTVLFADTIPARVAYGYQDGTNLVPISEDSSVDNDINSATLLTSLVKTIPHYSFASINMVDANGNVTPLSSTTLPYLVAGSYLQVVYTADNITIPVSYVGPDGQTIQANGELTGLYNQTVTSKQLQTQQIDIFNYRFDHFATSDGTPITGPVTFAEVEGGLQAVYRSGQVNLPVRYVNVDGESIATDGKLSGDYKTPLTADELTGLQIDIPNYRFDHFAAADGTPITSAATFADVENNGIQAVYRSGQVNLTVKYTTADGQTIAADGQLSGDYKTPLTADELAGLQIDIPNYRFDHFATTDGTPITLAVTFADVENNGIQAVYRSGLVNLPVKYTNVDGESIAPDGQLDGIYNSVVSGTALIAQQIEIPGYRFDHFTTADGSLIVGDVTYEDLQTGLVAVYRSSDVTVTIKFIDQIGNPIAPDMTWTGSDTDVVNQTAFNTQAQPINGYTFREVRNTSGTQITIPTTFEQLPTTLVFLYSRNIVSPGNPNTLPIGGNFPGDDSSNPGSPDTGSPDMGSPSTGTPDTGSPSNPVTFPTNPATNPPVVVEKPALMGQVIYALNSLKLYNGPDFETSQVLTSYEKKPRIYRPRFKVIGWALDTHHQLRFQVRDINEESSTFGLVGYVTADPLFVRGAYYQSAPAKITVINPAGINAYSSVNLRGKLVHYRQGTVLQVKRVIIGRTATRFVLQDGSYVTANKTLVKMGSIEMPHFAVKTQALNRYDDLQLTKPNRHYKTIAPQTFRIKGWDYSDGYNYHVKSLKRYLVSGGYITAYSVLVKAKF